MAIYFIASVKNNHLDEIQSVAQELENKGCRIIRVTRLLGIITGCVEDNQSLEQLKIEGIDQIEIDRKIKPT